ncbi:MAG: hypothetical protein E7092_08405 [Bacteroidales bacterium]|nr:hypothetical protein [Bacteroidales bacterium]
MTIVALFDFGKGRHSTRLCSLLQSGSSSTMARAMSRTYCNSCSSRERLAIFRSKAMPLCCVPSMSPGPPQAKHSTGC